MGHFSSGSRIATENNFFIFVDLCQEFADNINRNIKSTFDLACFKFVWVSYIDKGYLRRDFCCYLFKFFNPNSSGLGFGFC